MNERRKEGNKGGKKEGGLHSWIDEEMNGGETKH